MQPCLSSPVPPAHCWPQVLLNVLADEIHRAHQRCLLEDECDPNRVRGVWLWLWIVCRGRCADAVVWRW